MTIPYPVRCKRWSVCAGLLLIGSAATASAHLPEVQQSAGLPSLSGGVSIDEREALLQISRDDNLQLIFAARKGEYLSDVDVTMATRDGRTV